MSDPERPTGPKTAAPSKPAPEASVARISRGPLTLGLLAILVGVIAGLGAVGFRMLIALVHNGLILGQFSVTYNANVHTPPSPWGIAVILVPVVGAVIVVFLTKTFAPEAKGHGVPEVIDAIYYLRGIIRPVVAAIKALASAISIGSGGSVGREGPIIQIGSSFGSTVGQIVPMLMWQRNALIAAGAGGGIAATFNTPVGGVLFAIEIMMAEVSARTLVPVVMATITATYIGQLFFGAHPSFVIPALETPLFSIADPWVLLSCFGLGVLTGLVSALFIRALYGTEDLFEKHVPGNAYTRHMLGMLAVGVIMYLLMRTTGHYHVEGVGYATVQDILEGSLAFWPLLAALFALKLLATCLTLGSGASGGIFSPGLFMGATIGACYGAALRALAPGLEISVPSFAVAGMAGVVGGSTGAVMAAIVMIFEMTLDYTVIMPMTLTVLLSYGVRRLLSPASIYTLKLVRRGHHIPMALQTNLHHAWKVKDLMDKRIVTLPKSMPLGEFALRVLETPEIPWYLVEDDQALAGVVPEGAALGALSEDRRSTTLEEVVTRDYVIVPEDSTLVSAISRMRRRKVPLALIAADRRAESVADIRGLLTEHQITRAMEEAAALFSE